MADSKKYLDLGGLELFWGKVKAQYVAADKVISEALAQEVLDRGNADTALGERIDGVVADYTAADAALDKRIKDLEEDNTNANNIATLEGKVSTLIGDDTNKSVRTIANEELVKQLIPDNASESLNTLTEIAAWIQAHPGDAATMNAAITKNTADIKTNADAIDAIKGDYLKGSDKTELEGKINAEVTRSTGIDEDFETRISKLENDKSDSAAIEAEVTRAKAAEDKIEASVGLTAEGAFVANADSTYLKEATSVRDESAKLDAALKTLNDAYTEKMAALDAEDIDIRADFAAADTALQEAIDVIGGDYLKAADKTELEGAIDDVEGRVDTLETKVSNLETFASSDYVTEAEWEERFITEAEINAIFEA